MKCEFCNIEVEKLTNEHVVPSSLGGKKTGIKACKKCNNETLSELDKELASRTPLAYFGSKYLPGLCVPDLWTPAIDSPGTLLEAKLLHEYNAVVPYPQNCLFTYDNWHFYGNGEDMFEYGPLYVKCILRNIKKGFREFEKGRARSLIFEKIDNRFIQQQYRYPPRVFFRTPIDKMLQDGGTPIIRYKNNEDKRRILNAIEIPKRPSRTKKREIKLGSPKVSFQFIFDPLKVERSLLKLGFNLLLYAFKQTSENTIKGFEALLAVILGRRLPDDNYFGQFIIPDSVKHLHTEDDSHFFRIFRDGDHWTIIGCFFGGQACTAINFIGPSHASWKHADILVPLNSKDWQFNSSALYMEKPLFQSSKEFPELFPALNAKNSKHDKFLVPKKKKRLK